MTKEIKKEIEEMLVKLNNKYCKDHAETIWDNNFLINPNDESEGIVETKLIHIYYEYVSELEKEKTDITNLEKIRDELKSL